MANETTSASQSQKPRGRGNLRRRIFGNLLASDAGTGSTSRSRSTSRLSFRTRDSADRALPSGAASNQRDGQRLDAPKGTAEDDYTKDDTGKENTDLDEDEDMWAKAETKLREDAAKRKVLDKYKKILEERFNEKLQPIGTRARHKQFQRFFELERAAKEKEYVESGTKAGKIVKAVAKAVVASKDVLQPATSGCLPASVACAGVVVVVSFCLKAVDQRHRLLDSLESIAQSVCRIAKYEKLCRDSVEEKSADATAACVKACSGILEFQAKVAYFLQKTAAEQFARNMFEYDGWNDLLKEISEAEDRVFRCAQTNHMEKTLPIFQDVHMYITELLRRDRESDALRLNEKANNFLRLLDENTCRYLETKKRNTKHVPGTCEWFTNHALFNGWREGDSPSNILYVTADPGCGKSVLSAYLVDEVLIGRDEPVCYFFFKDDFEDQKTSTSAICAILHQLFDKHRYLLTPDILNTYEARKNTIVSSFEELWSILVAAARTQNIVCVLDALDECHREDMKQLLRSIASTTTPGLKFLLTSRPYAYIRRTITQAMPHDVTNGHVSRIHLKGDSEDNSDQIAQEIALVVGAEVNKLAVSWELDAEERQLVLDRLLSFEDRTYLWVALVIDGITDGTMDDKKNFTKQDILARTETVPQGIYAAYERILRRSQNQEQTRWLLQLILGAQRPLGPTEILVALKLCGQMQSWKDITGLDVSDYEATVTIRNLCGLFVTVVDNRVYLLHQTAREFLLRNGAEPAKEEAQSSRVPGGGGRNAAIAWAAHAWAICLALLLHVLHQLWLFLTKSWQHSMDLTASNEILATACMACLQPEFPRDRYPSFFGYAARYWPVHYRQSSSRFRAKRVKDARDLCVDSPSNREWVNVDSALDYEWLNDAAPPMSVSGLHLACYLGLDDAVKDILHNNISSCTQTSPDDKINEKTDSRNETALMVAVKKENIAVVRLLLQTGRADVNSKSNINETAVHIAARGEGLILQLLLATGKANVHELAIYGRTPLSYAAEKGNVDAIQPLLDNKAEVDAKDNYGRTPFSYAAEKGNADAIQLLLDNKAEVDAKDNDGRTPFSYAAQEGNVDALQLLLANKAKVDVKDSSGRTPLSYAVNYGNVDTIQPLLANKAEVDAKDNDGRTPLSYAAEKGNVNAIQLLLDNKAEVDVKDSSSRTPLFYAVDYINVDTIRLLLDNKAEVDAKDSSGRTPLLYAAEYGVRDVIQLLLDNKAKVDAKDSSDRTPLSYAAEKGNVNAIQLLLDNKAEVDAKDSSGRTPLSYAARKCGNSNTVRLLLANNAEADARDNKGRTPLSYAVDNYFENDSTVRQLLENHVEVDSKDERGLTPLYYAISWRNITAVKMLLDTGKVNTTDELYKEMMERDWGDVYDLLLEYQRNGGIRDGNDEQEKQELSADTPTTT